MRSLLAAILSLLWALPAWSLPPSSALTGGEGKLTWTVTRTSEGVTIEGSSPKWKVAHRATADLRPLFTRHTSSDGTTTVTYRANGATVTVDGKATEIHEKGLWDGDTVDIRLGQEVANGHPELAFRAIDPASGDVYGFDTHLVGHETCGKTPCTHIKLSLTGALRLVGPKWHYWYGSDGKLLRFEGPIGKFRAVAP